jgi:hypothetical protein
MAMMVRVIDLLAATGESVGVDAEPYKAATDGGVLGMGGISREAAAEENERHEKRWRACVRGERWFIRETERYGLGVSSKKSRSSGFVARDLLILEARVSG